MWRQLERKRNGSFISSSTSNARKKRRLFGSSARTTKILVTKLIRTVHFLVEGGNGFVDVEEYEYVMSEFGVPPKDAKNAFLMFSQNNEKKVDLEYFKELCTEYYRSDDPGALGNFINGKLDFTD